MNITAKSATWVSPGWHLERKGSDDGDLLERCKLTTSPYIDADAAESQ